VQDSNESDVSFSQVFSLLDQWNLFERADEIQPLGNAAVYKSSVVVHLMLYQRMNSNHSLKDAVEHFFNNAPITANSNKRVRERSLSTETGSYSAARKRLSVDLVNWLQSQVSDSIIRTTSPSFKSKRVFLIDGTTLSAAPTPTLQKAFPPSPNQYGEGVWPIIYLVTAHELSSGAALPPEIGPQYGPNAIGETRLAEGLIARLPPDSIVMADAAFGIFHVAFKARMHGHSFIFRLTSSRFESHLKEAELISESDDSRVYRLNWLPTRKDRASHPSLPADASLTVKIIATKIGQEWLYLITDIDATIQELKSLYFKRYDIEVDIRNIKVVLQAEYFDCKSVEMLHKEIGMAMVAYNLTSQLRRLAAAKAKRQPRDLSFTGVWAVYRHQLQNRIFINKNDLEQALNNAIDRASKQKLPNRPGRSYPREAYKRRPKSIHFLTRKRKEAPTEDKDAS
jgi:Transposase DDE domain